MTDRIEMRARRRESLILFAFTIFSVFLAYVSFINDWSPLSIPLTAIELAYVWWAYVRGFRSYFFRAIAITVLACLNISYYGIHGANFAVLIPTLSLFVVLFSLYQMSPVIDLVIVNNVFLFFYHLLVAQTFDVNMSKIERNRLELQLLSFIVLTLLHVYIIRRRQEEDADILELEEQMKRAQKIKDDFVVNTSHELRTPIHTISGMSEILLQEDLPDHVHREALDIQMTGVELQMIVSDIMDYAALESGSLELQPRAYNITSTINDIMNMTVYQNREKNLELIFDCDPGIPCSLYGDEGQLRRVINNLIGNAIKFTTEGGVTTSVTCRREAYGVNLIVKVKDTGIGMSAEELERVFQGFYQADADRNRRGEGMGLGLTISQHIIEKMGGFMTVRSEQGKGSEFSFSVPQQVLDERPCISLAHPNLIQVVWYYDDSRANARIRDDYVAHIRSMSNYLGAMMARAGTLAELKRRVRQTQFTHLLIGVDEYREDPIYFDELSLQMVVIMIADRSQPLPETDRVHILYKPFNAMTLTEIFNGGDTYLQVGRKRETRRLVAPDARILVVDDNIMNIKVIEGLLRRYRIRISAASSGMEALDMIETREYDFVFMDHMMPGMDGVECFHKIRAKQGSAYYQQVPIIALTANAIAGSREMFLEEGFNDFVAKPVDSALLDQILRKYIPNSKQRFEDAEKIDAAEDRPQAKQTAENDPFRAMEGIDMDTALAYCGGSLSDYVDLAVVYCESGGKYYPQLVEYHDAADWSNYAILTHAIKSTSKTIGAIKLSEIAAHEEAAAKEGDVATIDQYHPALLAEYERVLDVLRANPKIVRSHETTVGGNLQSMNQATWKRVQTSLRKSIETFEADAVMEIVGKYKEYAVNGVGFLELMKPVLDKVDAFDFEGAQEALSDIGGKTNA